MGGVKTDSITKRNNAFDDDNRRFQSIRESINNKCLLDFGCGYGGFLNMASNASIRYGIEIEEEPRRLINSEGIRCFRSIDEAEENIGCKVDVVSAFHVIEHMDDPVSVLRKLKGLKKEGGKIVVEVPNADDALLSLYKSKPFADFTYWSCHIFLFTVETIKRAAIMAGLKPVFVTQIQRYPLANTLYWLSNGQQGGHIKWERLIDSDIDEAYGKRLATLGIADTIWGEFV